MVARPPRAVPLAALAGFLALLALTIAGWAPLRELDTALSQDLRRYGEERPGLVSVLRVATDAAATVPFVLFGTALALVLVARGERAAATFAALVTVLVPVLWGVQHWLVHHPRPRDGFVVVTSNGFPSGHASNAAAAALLAVLLLWHRVTRTARVVAVVLATGFALFIGLTRVLLLAHWPADVLGGWLLALAVVASAARLSRRATPPVRATASR
ncbi:phosphatase PAP2 family protein [Micromonospora sp. NPDC049559]|uniref:phosphatase PAP2 family protein n=1 Tax=Micromonospora sp. NPDC049559 TaxID=3155923 RepID=UPI0034194ED1